MVDVYGLKVADFSGRLIKINPALQLYRNVCMELKQILPGTQNKTYFKIKYIHHTHIPLNHTFYNKLSMDTLKWMSKL